MKRLQATLIAALAAAFVGPGALAQPAPFDMSPELHLREEPVMPAPESDAEAQAQDEAEPVAAPAPAPAEVRRYFLPGDGIRLEGETGSRTLMVYLTPEQAAAPATLTLDLLNAIVVAPESSSLRVRINGTEIAQAPISFASEPTPLVAEVPEGILVPGANRLEISASQRHRTDCSVVSTYELWTDAYANESFLTFTGEDLGTVATLDDLPAVGLDAHGTTALRFLIPDLEAAGAGTAALRLVQELALTVKAPAVEVSLVESLEPTPPTGTLNVVMAQADALPEVASRLADEARTGAVVALLPPEEAGNTLVVSGPDWDSIAVAIASLGTDRAQAPRNFEGLRVDLATAVPMIGGTEAVSLETLGVETAEFNGRRYQTSMQFALPPDFYARMYGEAELVLDAAYSSAVQPGSQLDVYVNGQIAAVFPMLRTDGGTFRNSRLRIPMTNFRPGINEMHVEAILMTREDEVCPPGLSGRADPRFLFSSGSRLAFPDFGRIAQYPDLEAFAGMGAPYAGAQEAPAVLGGGPETLRAAMMMLSRVALSSGRVLPVTVVDAEALRPEDDALVFGPMGALDGALLERGRVVDSAGESDIIAGDTEAALNQWRRSTGAAATSPWDRVRVWAADQLDLKPENFWLIRQADGAYRPQSETAAILTQSLQPEGGVWTYLTIPQGSGLLEATRQLVQPRTWGQVAGRVSAVAPEDEEVLVLQPRRRTFVQSEPLSFSNMRLIAANWLSTNVLIYPVILALAAIALTLATTILLRRKGRGHQ